VRRGVSGTGLWQNKPGSAAALCSLWGSRLEDPCSNALLALYLEGKLGDAANGPGVTLWKCRGLHLWEHLQNQSGCVAESLSIHYSLSLKQKNKQTKKQPTIFTPKFIHFK